MQSSARMGGFLGTQRCRGQGRQRESRRMAGKEQGEGRERAGRAQGEGGEGKRNRSIARIFVDAGNRRQKRCIN